MFWEQYLENKKPTFLACIPEQVCAAILEIFQKLTVFFRTAKPTFAGSLKCLLHGFCKTVGKKRWQAKMEGTCYS